MSERFAPPLTHIGRIRAHQDPGPTTSSSSGTDGQAQVTTEVIVPDLNPPTPGMPQTAGRGTIRLRRIKR